MNKENIITLPNPHLRVKSAKVLDIDDSVTALIGDMTSACLDWEDSRPHEIGDALAAVQVDRLERIVIIRNDLADKDRRDFSVLINPEIVKYEGEIVTEHEGCLSVDAVYGLVPRYSRIRVRAQGIDGREIRFKCQGMLARVLQHEIDHTNGVVFVDRIKNDPEAFFHLDADGELRPLDYDEHIRGNTALWP